MAAFDQGVGADAGSRESKIRAVETGREKRDAPDQQETVQGGLKNVHMSPASDGWLVTN